MEKWTVLLGKVLERLLEAARKKNEYYYMIRSILELLAIGDHLEIYKKLFLETVVLNSQTSQKPTIEVEMEGINSFLHCDFQFKFQKSFVGQNAQFQLCLKDTRKIFIPISKIQIIFSNSSLNHLYFPSFNKTGVADDEVEWVNGTNTSMNSEFKCFVGELDLSMSRPKKIIQGGIMVDQPQQIEATHVHIYCGNTCLIFNLKLSEKINNRKWLYIAPNGGGIKYFPFTPCSDHRMIRVNRRQPNFKIETIHHPPGLLDEFYHVQVVIRNGENENMRAYISLEISNEDNSQNNECSLIFIDPNDQGKVSIEHLEVGMIKSLHSSTISVYLKCQKSAGTRTFSIGVFDILTLGIFSISFRDVNVRCFAAEALLFNDV